jgi:DNA sulfur modification protein DndD
MKFSEIRIQNFRQYYNSVDVDLRTNAGSNIIIIGGQNGYGKTNFLISIVWCLYGDKIVQVDENFRKEVQKEKNYSSFMQQSINSTAKKEGVESFSVSLLVSEIDLSSLKQSGLSSENLIIVRSFNVADMSETLNILDSVSKNEIFDDEADKVNFINDYIIPLDAAKFVFFDAEKISDIANLSIKDEGNFINDALGKVLGLDVFNALVEDMEYYINNLRKEGANKNLQEQIVDRERATEITTINIERFEEENAEIIKNIDELKKEIREYNNLISQNSQTSYAAFDRDSTLLEISKLEERRVELNTRFDELSEIIPLAMLSGKLEEVEEHLLFQDRNEASQKFIKENSNKIDDFIELLFNKPPEPKETTMSFKDKLFYYEKARKLGSAMFNDKPETSELTKLQFEYDLNNAEKKMISDAIILINTQSRDLFEVTIEEFNRVRNELQELNKKINKADADSEDELVLEYSSKKETADYKITENNRKIGENNQAITKSKKDIARIQLELTGLIKKVDVNAQNKLKIKECTKYIDVLKVFLEEQKRKHKISLEKTILEELKKLMHKLNSKDNDKKFIEDVEVIILAASQGMKITLLDQDDLEIRKESLSSGEKQIYIYSLIKAILCESIKELPIFIDTPLGRLDEDHRNSITENYYPNLSRQVVLFSTNSEITPKRFRDISSSVSKSYLLVNDGVNTKIKTGYYNSKTHD